ncbi:MAG: hypothetical protein KGY68_04120 [Candidatus Thermoplasmatota archaeon]|nr:hypothetical protein [Candidatus Thermoplasmatota archaeon]
MVEVDLTTSGLKLEGSWEEICEFSKELEDVMDHYVDSKEEIEEYDKWMPHRRETEEDIKNKTVEEAVIKEKKVEKDFEGAKEVLSEAEDDLAESIHDLSNGIDPSRDLKEALLKIEKVAGVESLRSIRKAEKTIYRKIMLKFNPYYFDTEDFSVNLDHKNQGVYVLCINVSDDDLREHFQDSFG